MPEARVTHSPPTGWNRFLHQHYSYGRGAWLYLRGADADPAASASGWLRMQQGLAVNVFRGRSASRALQIAALTALSQALTLTGFLREALRPAAERGARPPVVEPAPRVQVGS